jgi:putative copper resistance protein D
MVAAAVGGGVLAVLVLALAVGGADLVDAVAVARLVVRVAAVGTVGALVFAAVLRPGTPVLPQASRRALRAASAWATAWAGATVVHALLTLDRIVGPSLTPDALRTFLTSLPAGRAAVVGLVATGVVAATARRCTTVGGAATLLALAGAALVVPTVLTGHSAAADDHVLAVTTLSVHVVAASVWVGGLLALLVHGRGSDDPALAATRFSAVALGCFLATGASGLLAAWLVLSGDLASALATGYGWLLLAKTSALVALGLLGWQHRRRTLPRLCAGDPGSFRRFALGETAVLLATVALAVALSSSPPPAPASAAGTAPAAAQPPTQQPADPMAGHDHGELSVAVLVDGTRFHVTGPVDAGSRVTVHNSTATEVTITADNGSFDVVVPGHALMTFAAPADAGSYAFTSRHDPAFSDVLEVR